MLRHRPPSGRPHCARGRSCGGSTLAIAEAGLVEASARFTRPDLERHGREGRIVEVMVERLSESPDAQALQEQLRSAIDAGLRSRMGEVVPFIDVTALPPER